MKHTMRFIVYRDKRREYRWHLLAGNGRIIADSGEGYRTLAGCLHGIFLVRSAGDVRWQMKR